MNPYHRLFDAQNDVSEHAHELAIGMAIPYCSEPPSALLRRSRYEVVDELRAARKKAAP